MARRDLCPSSGEVVPEGGVVRCPCGLHWAGVDRVPLHDTHGHRQDPGKLAARIDRALEGAIRRRLARRRAEILELARSIAAKMVASGEPPPRPGILADIAEAGAEGRYPRWAERGREP